MGEFTTMKRSGKAECENEKNGTGTENGGCSPMLPRTNHVYAFPVYTFSSESETQILETVAGISSEVPSRGRS